MTYSRKERIQQIVDCGQSIIDNAEQIYGDYKFPQELEIQVHLNQREVPTITVVRKILPEKMVEHLL